MITHGKVVATLLQMKYGVSPENCVCVFLFRFIKSTFNAVNVVGSKVIHVYIQYIFTKIFFVFDFTT